MKIENVNTIIWDLDGTMIDSFGVFERVLRESIKGRGHAMPSREELAHHFHGSLGESIQNALGLEPSEEADAVLATFLEKQVPHYENDAAVHLFDDAVALAQRAAQKDMLQILLTNRSHEGRGPASPREIVATTVLAEYIREIRCGDEVIFTKPDKRSIEDYLTLHNVQPENLLVIGDQFVDVQLAINLGSRALWVQRDGENPYADKIGEYRDKLIIVQNLHDVELV